MLIHFWPTIQFIPPENSFQEVWKGNIGQKWVNLLNANPQNGQAHLNNCLNVFDHFVGLELKGLRKMYFALAPIYLWSYLSEVTYSKLQPN